MCLGCWDVDKQEEKLKNNIEVCTGEEMLVMSLEELKGKLVSEWMETKKTHFRVFKQAVPEIKSNTHSWQVSALNQQTKIHVNFI